MEVDVPYQWLTFFLDDDEKLADIADKYSKGKLLSGEVKAILSKLLEDWTKKFQERRKKVTDADVKHYMSTRKIDAIPRKWKSESASPAPGK